MDTISTRSFRQLPGKTPLPEWLSAGESETATRGLVVAGIPHYRSEDLLHAAPLTHSLDCPGVAYFDTAQALVAAHEVDHPLVIGDSAGAHRAFFDTIATADAVRFPQHDLWVRMNGFGVAAPRAAERAALEEHRRADARPILDREPLDIEDQAFMGCRVRFRHCAS